ncbi:MAG: response regulator transcription factor [Gammaproteobacteria bacterium]|nr:response regulator transcription factor [Gammaproteobacteria bacterium]
MSTTDPLPTVFVVDDDAAVRQSLSLLMRSMGLPVEPFESAQDFLARARPSQPGCLVLDIRMPGMSGLELQEELSRLGFTLPVIFITGHGDVAMAVRAMKTGAVDFIEKPFSDQVLLERVNQALELDRATRDARAEIADIERRLAQLSPREREVMSRIVAGQANKVIAIELGLSERTVEIHRAKVMSKTGARSLAELVSMVTRLDSGA